MRRVSVATVLLGSALLVGAAPVSAQGPAFGPELLPMLRRVAELMPGERAVSVRFVSLLPGRGPRGAMVEGAPAADTVVAGYPVYQLRFRKDWIMVDAGVDSLFVRPGLTFSRPDYDAVQRGLRGARLLLLTHEHPDHVAALFRSPSLSEVQQHTLLTRAQVRSLVEHPLDRKLGLDSAPAANYLVVDYQGWMPIAPGVVLLQAPGHSAGTQLVYVRLASGKEILIAGDVAWHTSGITEAHQKPERISKAIGEDREAIAAQLKWLKEVSDAGVAVVVYHDQAAHDSLVARGILKQGFDLRP